MWEKVENRYDVPANDQQDVEWELHREPINIQALQEFMSYAAARRCSNNGSLLAVSAHWLIIRAEPDEDRPGIGWINTCFYREVCFGHHRRAYSGLAPFATLPKIPEIRSTFYLEAQGCLKTAFYAVLRVLVTF